MELDVSEIIKLMPENWWKTKKYCDLLAQTLQGYILGLLLSGKINGNNQATIYTGFLWVFESNLYWITAGHVLDQIKKITKDPSARSFLGRWLDWEGENNKVAIPVDLKDFDIPSSNDFPEDPMFLDLGLVMIRILESDMIKKNSGSVAFNIKHYQEMEDFCPEGYILMGFPNQVNNFQWNEISNEYTDVRISTKVVAIPIERIPFPKDINFAKMDQNAFYGKILNYSDSQETYDITGMSGGPILGIKRHSELGIDYRVVGIQHGWKKDHNIIQAEPFKRVLKLFSDNNPDS